ncbi:cytochrome P450 [Mycena epipterygia]|nr:cytochrome P450 [Mycena epipterygia]
MHSIDLTPAIGATKKPIVGNMFDLPTGRVWETYKNWSQKYNSDIIHLDLAGTSVIVLSSSEATDDLLEKRSSIYSDRRTSRRLFSQEFNVISSRNFRPKEIAATHGLLRRLLHTPDEFRTHIKQMAGEFIMSVAYGIDVLPDNDPYIELAEQMVQSGVQAAIPGRFLVDSIPMLKHVPDWLPGAGFKRLAKEWKNLGQVLKEVPFAEVKRQLVSGTAPHSFAAKSLQTLSEAGATYYDEDTIKSTSASMYAAGSDTTVTALSTFILAMLANPDAQKKAQMEIYEVIGPERLPDFNDEKSLPYVSALVKEVLRWRPVTPIAIPHYLAVEDEYRGYRLPAGSIIIGNVWAIMQDKDMYPDPNAFKPERFLCDDKLNPDVRDPQAAFGFGRRICPARHMATSSVWITAASILAVFDITKAVGEDGKIIEPSYEYSPDLISAPLPFKCSIKPRSTDAVALVEATVSGD